MKNLFVTLFSLSFLFFLTTSISASHSVLDNYDLFENFDVSIKCGTFLPSSYTFGVRHDNLYPIPSSSKPFQHPINMLAGAPIYLQNGERLDAVRTDFYVSNYGSFPAPNTILDSFYFLGGSFPGGVFTPSSVMRFIRVPDLPLPVGNDAEIIIGGGGDLLEVRYDYINLNSPLIHNNNGYYWRHTDIFFKKIVPINVRR